MGQVTVRQLVFSLGVLLLAFLVFLGLSSTGRRLALGMGRPFLRVFRYVCGVGSRLFTDMSEIELERRSLELRVRSLELELASQGELSEENRQLRQILHLRPFPGWTVIQSEVLTRDPAFWDLRFTIDKGSAEGIQAGSGVLFGGNLIGRIVSVERHSSLVETIVSPTCHVSVTIGHTAAHGLLCGTGRMDGEGQGGCIVNYLPLTADAHIGERLVTSGLGTAIPMGIPVALVRADSHGAAIQEIEHARKQAYASPVENWDSMRFVTVVVKKE